MRAILQRSLLDLAGGEVSEFVLIGPETALTPEPWILCDQFRERGASSVPYYQNLPV